MSLMHGAHRSPFRRQLNRPAKYLRFLQKNRDVNMFPPEVAIPPSNSTVSVSIIDTTSWAYKVPCDDLFLPRFPGLDAFDLCSYTFLITHNHRHALFDFGIWKDWENSIPSTVAWLKGPDTVSKVEKELVEILRHGATDPSKI